MWRERKELRQGRVTEESQEYAFYCTSATPRQYSAQQSLEIIRSHWSSSENASHYRREVSWGEDAPRISGRNGAYLMTTLRNLLLGLFELQKHRGKTQARTFPSWRRRLTHTQKSQLITRSL